MMKHDKIARGFSLMEILVVLTIISLLTLSSTPAFIRVMTRQKTQNVTSCLFHTLHYAKSEAIKRNQLVSICGSADFKHCESDWSQGYMVFIGPTNNAIHAAQILRKVEVSEKANIHSHKQPVIQYRGSGECLSRASLIVTQGDFQQKIVIYDSGRIRVS